MKFFLTFLKYLKSGRKSDIKAEEDLREKIHDQFNKSHQFFQTIDEETPEDHGLNLVAFMSSMSFGLVTGRVLMASQKNQFCPWYLLLDHGDALEYVMLEKIGGEWVRRRLSYAGKE